MGIEEQKAFTGLFSTIKGIRRLEWDTSLFHLFAHTAMRIHKCDVHFLYLKDLPKVSNEFLLSVVNL